MIGDPSILGLDPLWMEFLNYIHSNGGWKGPKMSWDPAGVDKSYSDKVQAAAQSELMELIERVGNMDLADNGGEMEGNVERPWRDEQ